MVATFATFEKVLIKSCYTSKDLSYFESFKKFFRAGQKNVTKVLKSAHKIKLQVWQFTSSDMFPEHLSMAAPRISGYFL